MTKKTLPKWDAEREAQLTDIVGDQEPVSVETVNDAAEALETTSRSVASKLRKMGFDVESTVTVRAKTFSVEEEVKLGEFVTSNPGVYTYAEIAELVFGDVDKAKSVQGKLLSMELTSAVKKTPAKEVVKQYTEEQEDLIMEMVGNGAFIEDIADALGKSINSVRGKTLSMSRSHGIEMPKQKTSHAKDKTDALEALGDVSTLTVEDIAATLEKSVRGVKTMLTHRAISCADYDGAKRAEKIAEKKEAAAA